MEVRQAGANARRKPDRSLVCEADECAEAILLEALEVLYPGACVVAEERVAREGPPQVGDAFILVDALDGTSGFLKGSDEFTVNVGVIEGGRPVSGFVYAPARNLFVYGGPAGAKAMTLSPGAQPDASEFASTQTRPYPEEGLLAVVSRSSLDLKTADFLKTSGFQRRQTSSSLKFCQLALGEADLYPRFGPTSEWDTAAGQAVLEAAGGQMLALDGSPFRYGKAQFKNGGFLAWGGDALTSADGRAHAGERG